LRRRPTRTAPCSKSRWNDRAATPLAGCGVWRKTEPAAIAELASFRPRETNEDRVYVVIFAFAGAKGKAALNAAEALAGKTYNLLDVDFLQCGDGGDARTRLSRRFRPRRLVRPPAQRLPRFAVPAAGGVCDFIRNRDAIIPEVAEIVLDLARGGANCVLLAGAPFAGFTDSLSWTAPFVLDGVESCLTALGLSSFSPAA
jgi:hypothetical protein